MATTVKPNLQYANSSKVSKKYNPFDAKTLRLGDKDQALYSKMLTNRFNLLKSLSMLPQTLHLATANWAQTEKAEVGRKPPLIIISSNRSAWIQSGIAAADAELAKRKLARFNNVSDFRALQATAGQKVSPPIYCPKRIGASIPRSVFVVVHVSEYKTYQARLAGSGITVVGWNFAKTIEGPSLAGFGASRFAAVQFCKTLRDNVNDLGAVWDYAWFFDDNVVALTNFPGLEIAEAEIAKVADQVCLGFKGADFAYPFSDIPPWARKMTGPPPTTLPSGKSEGILQQAGLWNMKYLSTNFLNFPPVYITSAEDISLNRYFNLQKTKYTVYDGIEVTKELTTYDGKSADTVNNARTYYANFFGAAESAATAKDATPPPPVNVNYNGKDLTVNAFITNQLLPKAPDKRVTAKCQAVEQITKTAMSPKLKLIADDALTTTFKINGTNAQAVELYNSP